MKSPFEDAKSPFGLNIGILTNKLRQDKTCEMTASLGRYRERCSYGVMHNRVYGAIMSRRGLQ